MRFHAYKCGKKMRIKQYAQESSEETAVRKKKKKSVSFMTHT
jgi:hypothetical protein